MSILEKYDGERSILEDRILPKVFNKCSKLYITFFIRQYLEKTHLPKRKNKHDYCYNYCFIGDVMYVGKSQAIH